MQTPWVKSTPVDDRSVGDIAREEVQIAFKGDGPMSSRRLVPLTPAATKLLNGSHRTEARRVLEGMLSTLDGREGVARLRGMSMASDQAAFATNLLMSNTEAGFYPDSVSAGDKEGFERSMLSLVPSVQVAKAQNTGWLDFGPRISGKLRSVIEQGKDVSRDDATEVALTMLHELQHSITPHNPATVEEKYVWLEEGIAETLAWWPGRAADLRERMGVPLQEGEVIDPFSVPSDSVASREYRDRHRSIQGLLELAGVGPYQEDGSINKTAYAKAERLLQAGPLENVAAELARAIVHKHRLDEQLRPVIADLILEVKGKPSAVNALAAALNISQ